MGRVVWKRTLRAVGRNRGHFDRRGGRIALAQLEWPLGRDVNKQSRDTESLFRKDGRQGRRGKAVPPSPAYLRRKMLEVTRVGSFYSFLPVMCRADPEQAGVLFPCNAAEWPGGSSPAVAPQGLCVWRWSARECPPACCVSPRLGGGGGWGLYPRPPLHAHPLA